VVKTMPLSVRVEAGTPCLAQAARKVASTIGLEMRACAVTDRAYREWSSSQDKISVSRPPASCQWMESDCQHWLGMSAAT
jgi:hypothetical protein